MVVAHCVMECCDVIIDASYDMLQLDVPGDHNASYPSGEPARRQLSLSEFPSFSDNKPVQSMHVILCPSFILTHK